MTKRLQYTMLLLSTKQLKILNLNINVHILAHFATTQHNKYEADSSSPTLGLNTFQTNTSIRNQHKLAIKTERFEAIFTTEGACPPFHQLTALSQG